MFKRIVVVKLFGGIGNQMFIYAAGRALALRTNSILVLDNKTGFKRDLYQRKFELSNFNIDFNPANNLLSYNYQGGSYLSMISAKLKRHIPFFNIRMIQEDNFHFRDEFVSIPPSNCYLMGYWQSEKYFADCIDIIRSDFIISTKMTNSVEKEAKIITELGNRAIALGVRRYQEVGEFVNLKVTSKDFYLKAMELLSSKVRDPVFICFTQVPEWVKENLEGYFDIKFISQKEKINGAIEDLYLMKLCKHFIISNSTFYWWGAWLSENESKIVIAPKNWVSEHTPKSDWFLI